MILTDTSKQLNTLGLPRNWQLFIVLHALLSVSLIFMSNSHLFNITNIILSVSSTIAIIVGFKKHHVSNKSSQWLFLVFGVLLISLSIVLSSLTSFNFTLSQIYITAIEQIGIFLLAIFSFLFMFRFEKEYKIDGITVSFSLIVISLLSLVVIIFPNLMSVYLEELNLFQQATITNLVFTTVILLMAITNQIICRSLMLKDLIRILMVLLLGMHFGLAMLTSFNTGDVNTVISRSSMSFYQITGAIAIAFIFLDRIFTNQKHHTASSLNNYFMLSASILAVVAIPLGIIIRDRMGYPPVSALIIGTGSFILSSIVIWRLQKLIRNINLQRENLKTIAYTDPLTGLFNYHGYLDKLSSKSNENLLVISLNVEDFKSINDLYGRSFGDDVLKSLAKRLEKTPGAILVARTGSDYFQAVFRSSNSNIPRLIKEIQKSLGVWDTVNNRRIAVPLTFGASHSVNSIKSEELARQAEQALKVSRNTHTDFTLFSKTASKNKKSYAPLPRHELREILQKAVDDNYLPIHFQPIYDLQNGSLKALELLIRVESKKHGLLLPGQFLGQAQAYGLLTSLTQVCVNMVAKCYSDLPNVTVNINVPPYMLDNPQVLKDFIKCFRETGLPMERFCIEVTEDGEIPTDHLIPAINLLKKQGFKIAMDDFGTGYSSLSRLSVLPVDVVKIDRSLLLAASAGNTSILESAISLTKRLGASTVVEGVETLEQLSLIRKLGADSVQGFLLSRPVQISKASLLSLNAVEVVPEF